jgi:hypothetical protein
MNLLGIQDVLKNASDQQLMQLMRSPDSTAPSYLVLSELNRRKEMRAHQAQQAQQPRSTVAQDLTSEENMQAPMGIRSLSTPEPGDEEYPAEEDSGIEAMREGGVIRMQAGTPNGVRFPSNPAEINANLSNQLDEGLLSSRLEQITSAQDTRSARIPLIANAMRDVRSLISSGMSPAQATQETLNSTAYRGQVQPSDLSIFNSSTTPPVAASTAAPITAPAASVIPPVIPPVTPPVTPPATNTAPLPNRPPVVPPANPPSSGIRTLTPNAASAAAEPSGLPTLAQNMERNLGLFPGIPQELLDRIKSSRTNEGERRREAQNMGLIEAGLRMAASNNPRLGAAFAEGAAPAVQSYSQQLSQIRQDQNADLTRDLAVAQQDLQRRYMAGQISASELQRQTQMLMSNNEIAARIRVAQMQAASAAASAGRNPQLELYQAMRANPELAEVYARANGRGPEALRAAEESRAEQRLATRVAALTGQINANRQLLLDPGGTLTEPQKAEIQEELRQLAVESRSLRAQMRGGLGGSLIPGENGAPPTYQLPGR